MMKPAAKFKKVHEMPMRFHEVKFIFNSIPPKKVKQSEKVCKTRSIVKWKSFPCWPTHQWFELFVSLGGKSRSMFGESDGNLVSLCHFLQPWILEAIRKQLLKFWSIKFSRTHRRFIFLSKSSAVAWILSFPLLNDGIPNLKVPLQWRYSSIVNAWARLFGVRTTENAS